MCNYMLTSGFWLRAQFHSHLRVRSHLHTPNVDYTAREREADYATKKRILRTREGEDIRRRTLEDFSFIITEHSIP